MMATNYRISAVVFLCLFLGGCSREGKITTFTNENVEQAKDYSKEVMEPEKYVRLIQGNHSPVKKTSEVGAFIYSIMYKPHEYIICKEEKKSELADTLLKRKVNEISDMEYYDLRIELSSGSGEPLKYDLASSQQYYDRVSYVSFDMQSDIKMVIDNRDTISCGLYHFERAYDAAPFITVLLGFPVNKNFKEKTIIIHNRIFENGIVKLKFSKKELNNLPKLKTI